MHKLEYINYVYARESRMYNAHTLKLITGNGAATLRTNEARYPENIHEGSSIRYLHNFFHKMKAMKFQEIKEKKVFFFKLGV